MRCAELNSHMSGMNDKVEHEESILVQNSAGGSMLTQEYSDVAWRCAGLARAASRGGGYRLFGTAWLVFGKPVAGAPRVGHARLADFDRGRGTTGLGELNY